MFWVRCMVRSLSQWENTTFDPSVFTPGDWGLLKAFWEMLATTAKWLLMMLNECGSGNKVKFIPWMQRDLSMWVSDGGSFVSIPWLVLCNHHFTDMLGMFLNFPKVGPSRCRFYSQSIEASWQHSGDLHLSNYVTPKSNWPQQWLFKSYWRGWVHMKSIILRIIILCI